MVTVMIELYIHIHSLMAYLNYEPVSVTHIFPSENHVKLIININKVDILVQSNKLIIRKRKPVYIKLKEKIGGLFNGRK